MVESQFPDGEIALRLLEGEVMPQLDEQVRTLGRQRRRLIRLERFVIWIAFCLAGNLVVSMFLSLVR